jgi:hypothetical protein
MGDIGWIIGSIILIIIGIAMWCCIRMGGNQDKCDDEFIKKHDLDILLYNPEDVTLDDCINMVDNNNLKAVINDGVLLGFTQE